MIDLDSEIQIAFGATEVLLVFVTVLFGIRYPQIVAHLAERWPAQVERYAEHKRLLLVTLVKDCMVTVVLAAAMIYLYAPAIAAVGASSSISIIEFDFTRTAFVFIWCLLWGIWSWAYILACLVWKRRGEKGWDGTQVALICMLILLTVLPIAALVINLRHFLFAVSMHPGMATMGAVSDSLFPTT
jgi:hypothetical protein